MESLILVRNRRFSYLLGLDVIAMIIVIAFMIFYPAKAHAQATISLGDPSYVSAYERLLCKGAQANGDIDFRIGFRNMCTEAEKNFDSLKFSSCAATVQPTSSSGSEYFNNVQARCVAIYERDQLLYTKYAAIIAAAKKPGAITKTASPIRAPNTNGTGKVSSF